MKTIRNLFYFALVFVFCDGFTSLEACRRCRCRRANRVVLDTVEQKQGNVEKNVSRGPWRRRRGKEAVAVAQPADSKKLTPEEEKREALEAELGTLFKDCLDLNNKDMSFKQFAQECKRLFKTAGDLPCVPKKQADGYKEVAKVFDSVSDSTSSLSIGLKLKSYKDHFPESVKAVFKKCSASSVLKVIKARIKLNSPT